MPENKNPQRAAGKAQGAAARSAPSAGTSGSAAGTSGSSAGTSGAKAASKAAGKAKAPRSQKVKPTRTRKEARKASRRAARKRPSRYSPQELRRRRLARRRALFALVVLIVVAAVVFFLVLRNTGDISLAENGIGTVFSRVQMAVSNVTGRVRLFTQRWHNYEKLEADYEALQLENQQLTLQLESAQEDTKEKERLQDLLDARSRYETLDPIYARVIARSPGQWFETFSINRGKNDGVTQGMAVVNGDGLVGRVYEAGSNYAKVLCIIDSRSSVACMVQDTRDNGIMRGQIADSSKYAECYVYYLPSLNNVSPGNAVITSGTDSQYPKGLHIGTVTAVSMDGGSDGSYAIVTPSVDFQHIEEVFVLREVVETDSDTTLPSLNGVQSLLGATATPNPNVTPTPAPTPEEPTWSYPSASPGGLIEALPEDNWAR